MAMSKTTNTYNRQNWEDADFPILCQTCLGDNPYIRMTKEKYGKECKICTRPFTVFRWCPGSGMRFKKSEVCQTCAKIKNVCQTCLLDLEFGLPTQVRDVALNITDDLPKSDVNKEFYIQNVERELATSGDGSTAAGALGKPGLKAKSEVCVRLARSAPYYKRNRPHICSFWVKGECRRGEECPYRHDKPTDPDDPLADQNIKDRYYGVNDPVAGKLLKRAAAMPRLDLPEDKSITTLYVGNLGEDIGESLLQKHFYQYGEVRNINLVAKQQYAFIQFTSRSAAELAADRTFNKLVLQGRRLNIKWGRSQPRHGSFNDDEDAHHASRRLAPVPGIQSLAGSSKELSNDYFNLDPQATSIPLPPGHGPSTSAGAPPNAGAMQAGPPPPMGMFPPRFPPGPPPHSANMNAMQPPPFFPPNFRPQMRPPTYYPQPPPIPGVGLPPLNSGRIHYPSQDPTQMGATPSNK